MNLLSIIPEKTYYHSRCDHWFQEKIEDASQNQKKIERIFYSFNWYATSSFLYGYDLIAPRLSWYLYPKKPSTGMGILTIFPKELIKKLSEYLTIEEIQDFRRVGKEAREILDKKYCKSFFRHRIVLPIEAFGDMEKCQKIMPMPKTMEDFLLRKDLELRVVPILRAYYFDMTNEDGSKEEVPATYETILKIAQLKKTNCPSFNFQSQCILDSEKIPPRKEMYWMLITANIFEETKALSYQKQRKIIQKLIRTDISWKGFTMIPEAKDICYAILYRFLIQGFFIYKNRFSYCKESLNSKSYLVVGYAVSSNQIYVSIDFPIHVMFISYTGSGICKKF